jgi:predicted Zn-dependent protease
VKSWRTSKALLTVWFLLMLLGLTSILASAPRDVYFHNRAVLGDWSGEEFWVPVVRFRELLTEDEQSKIKIHEPENQISITISDSETVSLPIERGRVPLVAVARALLLKKVDSNGVVDFVAVKTFTAPKNAESAATAPETASRRREYQIAKKRLDEILQVLPLSKDTERQERVDRIGQQVVAYCPLKDIPWRFVLVVDRAPNAACCGEGSVFVTTSLLNLGLSDDELAGAIGHEIAHGVRRHVFRRYDTLEQLKALLKDYERLQQKLANNLNPDPSLRAQVDTFTRRRDTLQHNIQNDRFYSQIDEEEADVIGLRYATEAGFKPDGLGSCLEKLNRFAIQFFGKAVLEADMTHPPVKRRLEILEQARRNANI